MKVYGIMNRYILYIEMMLIAKGEIIFAKACFIVFCKVFFKKNKWNLIFGSSYVITSSSQI